MFIVKSPIAAGVDDLGNKVIIPVDREVTLGDFHSETAFDRLLQIGAIEQIGGDPEIEIVPELWEDGEEVVESEPDQEVKPEPEVEDVVLTKSECAKLILASEVNANGENDEKFTQSGLMKHTSAELNQMVKELNK